MRTMLIASTLILFGSIAHFAQSEAIGTRELKRICSNEMTYMCLVPKSCTNPVPTQGNDVKRLTDSEDLHENCQALFISHAYARDFVHVTIASFDATVKSVQLIQTTKAGGKTQFSCIENNGTVEAKYGSATQTLIKAEPHIDVSKLSCTFVVKNKKKKDVFLPSIQRIVKNRFRIGDIETKSTEDYPLDQKVRCNPEVFKFNNVIKSRTVYKRVVSKPGRYYCEDAEIYKLEYRKDEESEYKEVKKVTCPESTFLIDGVAADDQLSIDIRCAADTRFFCDYDVHTKEGTPKLKRTSPDVKEGKASALACPDGKDGKPLHLIVGDTPFFKPVFECLFQFGKIIWTVKNDEKPRIPLHANGVVVHCTDELDCTKVRKIPDRAVTKGQVDGENLPACFDKGVLHVKDNVKDKTATVRCDRHTGKFMYTTEGDPEREVLNTTKFECKYPKIPDDAAEKAKKDTIGTAQWVSIGAAAFVGAVIIVFGIVYSNYRIQKRKRNANEKLAKDEAAWNRYCLDDDERQELKSKQETDKQLVDSSLKDTEIEHLSIWNNLQLHSFSVGLRELFSPGAIAPKEIAVPLDKQPEVTEETLLKNNEAPEKLDKFEKSEIMKKLEAKFRGKAREKCGLKSSDSA